MRCYFSLLSCFLSLLVAVSCHQAEHFIVCDSEALGAIVYGERAETREDLFETPSINYREMLYSAWKLGVSDLSSCDIFYEEILIQEAEKIGFDWRLLASIIYQESRFKPNLESSRGAYGLMQLMPVTMQRYGIGRDATIQQQVEAGCKLLHHFDTNLPASISDSLERQKFVLAAYNAGLGGVNKAIDIAAKRGQNPDLWTDNVELHVSRQTYHFVRKVLSRFEYYKEILE